MNEGVMNAPLSYNDYNSEKLFRKTSRIESIRPQNLFDEIPLTDFKTLFSSEENSDYLARRVMKRLTITNKHMFPTILNLTNEYIANWVNLGKFNNLIRSFDDLTTLDYYNNQFIEVFEDNYVQRTKHTTNPFLEVINGKTRDRFGPEDYNRLNVQQSRTLYSREVRNGKKAPFYEKALYKRHLDPLNDNTLDMHGNDRSTLLYTFSVEHPNLDNLDDRQSRQSTADTSYERETMLYNRFPQSDLNLLK